MILNHTTGVFQHPEKGNVVAVFENITVSFAFYLTQHVSPITGSNRLKVCLKMISRKQMQSNRFLDIQRYDIC